MRKVTAGRPRKVGVDRYPSGRIKRDGGGDGGGGNSGGPDKEPQLPKDGPVLSREQTWLRSKLSPPAREAAQWYAQWIAHRNRWLGYDEWKLPGCDLTVSTRLGRKAFTALVMTPGRYEPRRPSYLSSDGVERDDLQSYQLDQSRQGLTHQFAQEGERPSAADAAASVMQADEAVRLEQRRFITQIEYFDSGLIRRRRIPMGERGTNVVYRKGQPNAGEPYQFDADEMMGRPEGGPFPPRRPLRPAYAPPPTEADERCPGCTGSCKLQSEGDDPCAYRERVLADHRAVAAILKERFAPVELHKKETIDPKRIYQAGEDWENLSPEAQRADKRQRTGDIRRKRLLVDSFALDGQFPAPPDAARLKETLMQLHRFFENKSQSMGDWLQDDTRAKPLSVERENKPPREMILHIANTEGVDLKQLGREGSADAAHGQGMVAQTDGDLKKAIGTFLENMAAIRQSDPSAGITDDPTAAANAEIMFELLDPVAELLKDAVALIDKIAPGHNHTERMNALRAHANQLAIERHRAEQLKKRKASSG